MAMYRIRLHFKPYRINPIHFYQLEIDEQELGFEEKRPDWLKLGGMDDQAGLAPYFDMLNHGSKAEYNCNFMWRYGIGLSVTAIEDIEEGSLG